MCGRDRWICDSFLLQLFLTVMSTDPITIVTATAAQTCLLSLAPLTHRERSTPHVFSNDVDAVRVQNSTGPAPGSYRGSGVAWTSPPHSLLYGRTRRYWILRMRQASEMCCALLPTFLIFFYRSCRSVLLPKILFFSKYSTPADTLYTHPPIWHERNMPCATTKTT